MKPKARSTMAAVMILVMAALVLGPDPAAVESGHTGPWFHKAHLDLIERYWTDHEGRVYIRFDPMAGWATDHVVTTLGSLFVSLLHQGWIPVVANPETFTYRKGGGADP